MNKLSDIITKMRDESGKLSLDYQKQYAKTELTNQRDEHFYYMGRRNALDEVLKLLEGNESELCEGGDK